MFLNSHRAKSGVVDDQALDPDYVLLAYALGCGPIDRTGVLRPGFDYTPLDPIPDPGDPSLGFTDLCEIEACDIADQAIASGDRIDVFWSGGIDSTVALVALTRELTQRGDLDRLTVLLNLHSIAEYPHFYESFIADSLATELVPSPASDALTAGVVTVTGEHGDQLFGSDKLEKLVRAGVAHMPFKKILPFYLAEVLGSSDEANRVISFLEPQVRSAPVPVRTAFDYLWWCNFSLKWQQVSLRIPVFGRLERMDAPGTLRHFFHSEGFQRWALQRQENRFPADWSSYKLEAKAFILAATNDVDYFRTKEKSPSLKNVIVDRASRANDVRYRVHVRDDLVIHTEPFDVAAAVHAPSRYQPTMTQWTT